MSKFEHRHKNCRINGAHSFRIRTELIVYKIYLKRKKKKIKKSHWYSTGWCSQWCKVSWKIYYILEYSTSQVMDCSLSHIIISDSHRYVCKSVCMKLVKQGIACIPGSQMSSAMEFNCNLIQPWSLFYKVRKWNDEIYRVKLKNIVQLTTGKNVFLCQKSWHCLEISTTVTIL